MTGYNNVPVLHNTILVYGYSINCHLQENAQKAVERQTVKERCFVVDDFIQTLSCEKQLGFGKQEYISLSAGIVSFSAFNMMGSASID
jgi:hypothetical protein